MRGKGVFMRYISISHLKEGMVLGSNIYDKNFRTLLASGMTLSAMHVQRINEMGYAGVYVLEPSSGDVIAKDIVPADVRLTVIRAAKEFIEQAQAKAGAEPETRPGYRKNLITKVPREKQERIMMPLIDALIENERQIVDVIDLKPFDYYDYYHAANCVVLSLLLGLELGISGAQLFELAMAALLHDVGNVFIPKQILDKPGKLTPEEYDIIKSHTKQGFDYLYENYDISVDACIGALHHHENYDGTGYPNGLSGKKISIYGRIIAITDVYDAMVSRRPFRPLMFPAEALRYLREKAGTMFDPEIVDALGRVVALYPAGVEVELDNDVRCLVVENYPQASARPRLRMLGGRSEAALYFDLNNDPACSRMEIKRIVEGQ